MKNFLICCVTLLAFSSQGVAYAMLSARDEIRQARETDYRREGEADAVRHVMERKKLMKGEVVAREFENHYLTTLQKLCLPFCAHKKQEGTRLVETSDNLRSLKTYLDSLFEGFNTISLTETLNACGSFDNSDRDHLKDQILLHENMKEIALKFTQCPLPDMVENFFYQTKKIFFSLKGLEVGWLHLKEIELLTKGKPTLEKDYEAVHLEVIKPLTSVLQNSTTEERTYERTVSYLQTYAQALHKGYQRNAKKVEEMLKSYQMPQLADLSRVHTDYVMRLYPLVKDFAAALSQKQKLREIESVFAKALAKQKKLDEKKIKGIVTALAFLGNEFAHEMVQDALNKEWPKASSSEQKVGYQKMCSLMDDMKMQPSEEYDEHFFHRSWVFLQTFCKGVKEVFEKQKKLVDELSDKQRNLFKVRFCLLLLNTATKITALQYAGQEQAKKIILEYENKLEEIKRQQDNLSP